MVMTLERTVGPLEFENPLIVGAGVCKTLAETKRALDSAAAGVEIGSILPKDRPGNEGHNFHPEWRCGVLLYTLNSLGMPNPGRDDVSGWAAEALRYAHERGKLLGVNIAGDTVSEIVLMVHWAIEMQFDWITINAGCPNKFDRKGTPQSILSFDLEQVDTLLYRIHASLGQPKIPIWWKSSPDNDTLGHQVRIWNKVADCPSIAGIVANNTVPHCFDFNEEKRQAIEFGTGLAGMGGPAVKPKALGDILRLSTNHPHLQLVGAGGVTVGEDIADYLRTRAHIVQCTSVLWANNFNYRLLGDILADFCEQEELYS